MLRFSSRKKFTRGSKPHQQWRGTQPERGSVSVRACNRMFYMCQLKILKYKKREELQGKGSYRSNYSLMTILINSSTVLSTSGAI